MVTFTPGPASLADIFADDVTVGTNRDLPRLRRQGDRRFRPPSYRGLVHLRVHAQFLGVGQAGQLMAAALAKMRGIKPDIWTDDKFVEVPALARLLFIGMWNFACDNGHLEHKARQLKMRILPADDTDVESLLDELVVAGLVTTDAGYITIPNFTKHQRVDRRFFRACGHCEGAASSPDHGDDARGGPPRGHDEHSDRPRRGPAGVTR